MHQCVDLLLERQLLDNDFLRYFCRVWCVRNHMINEMELQGRWDRVKHSSTDVWIENVCKTNVIAINEARLPRSMRKGFQVIIAMQIYGTSTDAVLRHEGSCAIRPTRSKMFLCASTLFQYLRGAMRAQWRRGPKFPPSPKGSFNNQQLILPVA